MIKSINIAGYKSIDKKSINLELLTILCGLNSSGKSSLIQSLRTCLGGNYDSNLVAELGEYNEIKSIYTPAGEDIKIVVESDTESSELKIDSNDQHTYDIKNLTHVEYISSDRHGPKTTHPIIKGNKYSVGDKGEYIVDYFEHFQNVIVHELLRHPSATGHTLKHQLPFWMNEICPGVTFDFSVDRKHDISHIEINKFRATNTGFGISYSLPIVVALLTLTADLPKIDFERNQQTDWMKSIKTNGAVLLIENPEAHLHPKGQTFMGHLATLASSAGLQVIVETHSDHFIDGVRISIKENESIKNENIIINFFDRENKSSTNIKEIRIERSGKIDNWPKGFFDQFSINLRKLNRKG